MSSNSKNTPPREAANVAVAKKPGDATSSQAFRLILLVLMVLQNTATVLVGRYSRASASKEDSYVVNHLIVTCEAVKLLLSCALEYNGTSGQLYKSMKENIFDRPLDAIKIIIPSLLYLVQNSLLYVALSNLSAPLFQVTYQAKLLTTAVVSVIMLNRRYSFKQWICLSLLGVGVAIVVLGESGDKSKDSDASTTESKVEARSLQEAAAEAEEDSTDEEQNLFVGLVSVSIACLSSALAGVYFEKVLKKPTTEGGAARAPVSLWMRNIQMAFFSVCIGFIQYMGLKGDDAAKPFMHGFTSWVYVLVCLQAGGGLLVAAVIKYADNVLKGMATGVSVCFGSVCSMLLFGTVLSGQFFTGASLVLGSVYFFSNELPCAKPPAKKMESDKAQEMKPLVLPK